MTETVKRMKKYPTSDAVKALNPGFFGWSSYEAYLKAHNLEKPLIPNDSTFEPTKPLISNPGAIAPHSWNESTDEQKLNKTEKAYLHFLRSKGYAFLGIQNVTLKLADDCRLTCDFVYLDNGRLVFVDVKGFQREDALIKIKMAARMFRWATFQIVKKSKEGWEVTEVKP